MGLAYGITEMFNSLTAILAPLLAGILYTREPILIYPVSLALIGVALLISLVFAPRESTPGQPEEAGIPPIP
jgi:MFS family permease